MKRVIHLFFFSWASTVHIVHPAHGGTCPACTLGFELTGLMLNALKLVVLRKGVDFVELGGGVVCRVFHNHVSLAQWVVVKRGQII